VLGKRAAALLCLTAGAAFQVAYVVPGCAFLIAVYLWCLFELTRLPTAKQASYFGLLAGLLAFAPQLFFFHRLFGLAAVALWAVAAFWIRMFLVLGRSARARLGLPWAVLLIPFFWTGGEFFRSELYYLRFSWLNAGYVFARNLDWLPMRLLGNYGFGFALMALIALASLLRPRPRLIAGLSGLAVLALLANLPGRLSPQTAPGAQRLSVAGVQMEFPAEMEVLWNLDKLAKAHPEAQLLVLSEYTVTGPVPEKIKAWCRKNGRYLVIGAEDPAPESNYYDTAFVIGPDGTMVFSQGKSVPVQFFKDGLAAKTQRVWDSPWGKLGFCVCYDLSYRRVTDPLIRMGAQAIIVPTMDVEDWGRQQHELHALVAPVRAAEYGVPIFRVASSGFSQAVDATGNTLAVAPMPGDGAMLAATLDLPKSGSLPLDRIIAPWSVWDTGGFMAWVTLVWLRQGWGKRSGNAGRRASPAPSVQSPS
jgi:apolipoprotein N-acyltransferase